MASPFKTSPLKTGRLSLLGSDIEEDLGLIDFNDPQFDFLSRNDYWPFENINCNDYETSDAALEWISSHFAPQDHDPYFDVKTSYETPSNGRFDYLTKSVARTQTITRRRAENDESATPTAPRFGTITKRNIQTEKVNRILTESSQANRTYEIVHENGRSSDSQNEIVSDSNSDSSMFQSENSQTFTRPTKLLSNRSPVNTNTITKNRRPFVQVSAALRYDDSMESDLPGSEANDLNSTCASEELVSDDISNNYDLNRRNHPLNRTYDKTSSDTDDSNNIFITNGQSSRNYPTISRNITRTLIGRETSQGQLNYSSQMPVPQYSTSNDDLLSSDSSSVHSGRSNLTMTSSMSGRSEPNLAHNLSIPALSNQNKKLPIRSAIGGNRQIPAVNSKIARPVSQNGPTNGVTRKPMSKLPSSNSTFGSMNSLQANMARASSQTALGMELNDDNENIFLNGNASKLLSAVSRNSTFRVHRPSPIVNVASVFADQPVATMRNASSVKYNSDDNILHCSQEEIDQFRAKVLNSSIGNLRTVHAYQPSHQEHSHQHHHHNYNNRSDSPSSNSSSCSSNSSSSRMRMPSTTNLANRLNNNNGTNGFSHGTNGSFDIDCKALGLKGISNNNNNLNSTFGSNPDNHNLGLVSSCDRNGTIVTNSKATSRIPALPKSIATATPNRSGIPVSGAIPRRTSPSHETLLRKSKLASAYQSQPSSKMAQHLMVNPAHVDENSWKNDCF